MQSLVIISPSRSHNLNQHVDTYSTYTYIYIYIYDYPDVSTTRSAQIILHGHRQYGNGLWTIYSTCVIPHKTSTSHPPLTTQFIATPYPQYLKTTQCISFLHGALGFRYFPRCMMHLVEAFSSHHRDIRQTSDKIHNTICINGTGAFRSGCILYPSHYVHLHWLDGTFPSPVDGWWYGSSRSIWLRLQL